jgi:hypothetical protein
MSAEGRGGFIKRLHVGRRVAGGVVGGRAIIV